MIQPIKTTTIDHRRFATPDEAARALATEIGGILDATELRGEPTLLLLSGGSSLHCLDYLSAEPFDERVTIIPLDDRYDPTGATSNSRVITETSWYRDATARGAMFVDATVREGESRDALAARLDDAAKKWLIAHEGNTVVGILGVGDDGHTAGIFPDADPLAFRDRFMGDRLYVGYRGSETAITPERVTATFTLISRIGRPFLYYAGPSKARAWEASIAPDVAVNDRPAAFYREYPGMVVFSSSAA